MDEPYRTCVVPDTHAAPKRPSESPDEADLCAFLGRTSERREERLAAADYVATGLRESGHCADHAADGAEGLTLALASRYDVIVADRMLPCKPVAAERGIELRVAACDAAIVRGSRQLLAHALERGVRLEVAAGARAGVAYASIAPEEYQTRRNSAARRPAPPR